MAAIQEASAEMGGGATTGQLETVFPSAGSHKGMNCPHAGVPIKKAITRASRGVTLGTAFLWNPQQLSRTVEFVFSIRLQFVEIMFHASNFKFQVPTQKTDHAKHVAGGWLPIPSIMPILSCHHKGAIGVYPKREGNRCIQPSIPSTPKNRSTRFQGPSDVLSESVWAIGLGKRRNCLNDLASRRNLKVLKRQECVRMFFERGSVGRRGDVCKFRLFHEIVYGSQD